jgi:hypothetical protein
MKGITMSRMTTCVGFTAITSIVAIGSPARADVPPADAGPAQPLLPWSAYDGDEPTDHGDAWAPLQARLVAEGMDFGVVPAHRLALAGALSLAAPVGASSSGQSAGEGAAASAPSSPGAADLVKQAQNPIANLISLPLQNNLNFGVGPGDDVQYVLNIQPVIPVAIGESWNLINRTIVPVVYQPSLGPGIGSEFGLGDVQYQGYFSPSKAGPLTWGVGAVMQFPTATDDVLGTGKWSAGPGFVALRSDGPWVYGGLINNIWSFAGDDDRADVNQMLIQPFVNYNFEHGWYLMTAPIITANWEASSDDRWTVPLGGGIGKLLKFGNQPVNISLQAYGYVERPAGGPEWGLRFQVQFLFPK